MKFGGPRIPNTPNNRLVLENTLLNSEINRLNTEVQVLRTIIQNQQELVLTAQTREKKLFQLLEKLVKQLSGLCLEEYEAALGEILIADKDTS